MLLARHISGEEEVPVGVVGLVRWVRWAGGHGESGESDPRCPPWVWLAWLDCGLRAFPDGSDTLRRADLGACSLSPCLSNVWNALPSSHRSCSGETCDVLARLSLRPAPSLPT